MGPSTPSSEITEETQGLLVTLSTEVDCLLGLVVTGSWWWSPRPPSQDPPQHTCRGMGSHVAEESPWARREFRQCLDILFCLPPNTDLIPGPQSPAGPVLHTLDGLSRFPGQNK